MNDTKQLSFSFPVNPHFSVESYIHGEANDAAFRFMNTWPSWSSRFLNLYGPSGVGKTHLAEIWKQKVDAYSIDWDQKFFSWPNPTTIAEKADAFVIDNLKTFDDEEWFFHFYNAVALRQGYILAITPIPIAGLKTKIPDLRSRLLTFVNIPLHAPDDAMLGQICQKILLDRGMQVSDESMTYILNRIDRSYDNLQSFIRLLDELSLSQHKVVTVPFLRQLFHKV